MSINLLRNASYLDIVVGGITASSVNTNYFTSATMTANTLNATTLVADNLYYTGATGQQLSANLLSINDNQSAYGVRFTTQSSPLTNSLNYVCRETGNTYSNIVVSSGTTCGQGGAGITGGVTCNNVSFMIHTNTASISGNSSATFTVYSSKVSATSQIIANINNYSNDGNGFPFLQVYNVSDGSFSIRLCNASATSISGTFKISVIIC
jgi:hypothetical protein